MAIIAYYRVSTARQGQSGLGLEGQRMAIEAYARQHSARIIATYTEVESGRRHENRPQLAAALAHAKAIKASLVVAKLDRLARNVAFLASLLESGVDFFVCDNPHASKLTLHILAAVAEDELERISARMKAAIAAAKARGMKFGAANPKCRPFTREVALMGSNAAHPVNQRLAREFRTVMRPIAVGFRSQGRTLECVASALNEGGYRTRRGKAWTVATVSVLLRRSV